MMRIIKKMYDSDDLQSILNDLNADEIYKQRFMGFVESFTRFDSDVCEQFLDVYELCVKKYYN